MGCFDARWSSLIRSGRPGASGSIYTTKSPASFNTPTPCEKPSPKGPQDDFLRSDNRLCCSGNNGDDDDDDR